MPNDAEALTDDRFLYMMLFRTQLLPPFDFIANFSSTSYQAAGQFKGHPLFVVTKNSFILAFCLFKVMQLHQCEE